MIKDPLPLEDIDPVFLAYGKACFIAQNLESTLRFLLVVHKSAEDKEPISPSAISTIEADTFREALFALFGRARKAAYFKAKEERQLREAIKKRNYLIHEYWDKNAMMLLIPEGRASIIADLEAITKLIRAADLTIVSFIDRYLAHHGMSTKMIKEWSGRLYKAGRVDYKVMKH
jgi:hypothetical protein